MKNPISIKTEVVDPNYYTDGKYMSSSTLQHSSPSVTFTKAIRFSKEEMNANNSNVNIKDTKSLRSTSFGYGMKQMNHVYIYKNAKTNPGPDHYSSNLKLKNIMGPSYKGGPASQELRIKQKQIALVKNPGPGSYNLQIAAGSNVAKYSIATKGGLQSIHNKTLQPGSSDYFPKMDLTYNTRYRKIGLGYGQKYDITKNSEKTPGPGAYSMFSKFDKLFSKPIPNIISTP